MNKDFHQFILPQSCFLCGDSSTQTLCTACLADLPYYNSTASCIRCAKTLEAEGVCFQCQTEPPPYTQTQAVFSYTYPVEQLIIAAKFDSNLPVLNLLGKLMAQHLTIEPRPDILIPVPLHSKRLRQRGYNQSLELAKRITKQTGIPLDYKACKRIKNTRPQTSLSAEKRKSNLVGAFSVLRRPKQWQYIVLIDDVMTTGTTVTELAKVWIEAGVQRVDVWCCARR